MRQCNSFWNWAYLIWCSQWLHHISLTYAQGLFNWKKAPPLPKPPNEAASPTLPLLHPIPEPSPELLVNPQNNQNLPASKNEHKDISAMVSNDIIEKPLVNDLVDKPPSNPPSIHTPLAQSPVVKALLEQRRRRINIPKAPERPGKEFFQGHHPHFQYKPASPPVTPPATSKKAPSPPSSPPSSPNHSSPDSSSPSTPSPKKTISQESEPPQNEPEKTNSVTTFSTVSTSITNEETPVTYWQSVKSSMAHAWHQITNHWRSPPEQAAPALPAVPKKKPSSPPVSPPVPPPVSPPEPSSLLAIDPLKKFEPPKVLIVRLRKDTSLPTGAPPAETEDGYLMLPRPLVPAADLIQARRMFLYSQAARCVTLSPFFTCSCGYYCDDMEYGTKGSEMLGSFIHENTAMRGMIAIHRLRYEIIIGFRATEKWADFTNFNLKVWATKSEHWEYGKAIPHEATIHSGYQYAYGTIRDDFLRLLGKAISSYPDFKIYITGHSMGGALAAIALIDAKEKLKIFDNSRLALYTFGAPPVGSLAFRQLFNNIETHRYVNRKDWVSRARMFLPNSLWEKLYHVGREIYITRIDERFAEHAYQCQETPDGKDDELCSKGEMHWIWDLAQNRNAIPHVKYWNSISGIEHCTETNNINIVWP